MLGRVDTLQLLYSKRVDPIEFSWDRLWAPSIYNFMSEYHIDRLYNIATSVRYAGDSDKKDDAIREILYPLGFRRFAAGTNRIVYTYLEDSAFLIKIAIDKVGLKNSPDEFRNQMMLKPFVAKCFEVHPSGVIASFERGLPITNLHEFLSIWDDVFAAIMHMTGKHGVVIEDIGADFFMNWCIRKNFGPILCDYPEVFELDGNKLYCNRPIYPGTKFPVCGEGIDYDAGFNYVVCPRCGKQYRARELAAAVKKHDIIMKGEYDMDVMVVRGDEILVDGRDRGTDTFQRPVTKKPKKQRSREVRACIVCGDQVIAGDKSVMYDNVIRPAQMSNTLTVTECREIIEETNKASSKKMIEDYLENKPELKQQILDIFGEIPDAQTIDAMNIAMSNFITASSQPTKMLPTNRTPVVLDQMTMYASSMKDKQINPSTLKQQSTKYSSQQVEEPKEQDLHEVHIEFVADNSVINNPTVQQAAAERLRQNMFSVDGQPVKKEDKGISDEESIEKDTIGSDGDSSEGDGDKTDSEGDEKESVGAVPISSDAVEEIGAVPPEEMEIPEWNIVDPNAPKPEEPDYNNINYKPDVDISEKSYTDKEPVGSNMMADALKGFRMDTPVHENKPPQFRKRPEVPDNLDNF